MRQTRLRIVAVVGVLTVNLVACGTGGPQGAGADAGGSGSSQPAAVAGGLDEVCAAGAQEGTFTYWATYEDDNWARVAEVFSAAHPGIDIDFLPLRDEDTTQRILTAVSAGQPVEPDLISNDLASQAPLVERELIDTEADWPALGVDEELISAGNVVRTYLVGLGLAYNTDTTAPEDLPSTWEELIDPRYAQNAIVDPRGRPFGFFALEWTDQETLDYAQRLRDVVNPILIEGGTAGMTAVLTGEALFSTGGRADSALELQADGAPIALKYLDLIPTEADYNALMVGAEHPNAARCFTGWMASPEGQQAHREIEFKENTTIPSGAPDGAVILSVETPDEADRVSGLFEQISQIFGPAA
jgi:iron(III) transport system substrate-binding protein